MKRGLSLLEGLIVLAIIAIVFTIAIPSLLKNRPEEAPPFVIRPTTVKFPDGRVVDCLVLLETWTTYTGKAAGVSCDWGGE